jgi:hypothetical protein
MLKLVRFMFLGYFSIIKFNIFSKYACLRGRIGEEEFEIVRHRLNYNAKRNGFHGERGNCAELPSDEIGSKSKKSSILEKDIW